MKSKLHIFVALFGWTILIAYVFYDYHEHGSDTLRHFFTPNDISETAFHLLILISPLGSSIIAYLINERKKLFTEVQQSEKKYRTLMESANDAIFLADLESGTILNVNKKAAELLGMPAEKIIDIHQSQLHPEEEAEYYKEIFRSHIQKGGGFESKVFIQRKDGYKVPVEISANVIEIQGKKVIQGIFRDITEREKAEGLLKESEEKYRTMIENSNDLIWTLDKEGNFTYFNKKAEEVSGYKLTEWLGKSFAPLIPQDDLHRIKEIFIETINGNPKHYDVDIYRKDGTLFSLSVNTAPIFKSDKIIGTVSFGHDITARKQTEEAIHLQLKRLGVLRSIDRAITASLDLRVTLDVLLVQITTNFGVDAATILLLNQHTQILEYVVSKGFRSSALKYTRLRLGESNAGRAAIERQILTIPNLKKEPGGFINSTLFNQEDFVTYCVVPLIAKGEVKGVLELFYRSQVDCDPEWLEFLETIADQAAIAIDNATLFEKLQSSNVELTLAYDTTIEGWSRAMDMRDKETEGHTQRVTEMTLRIAQEMGIKEEEFVHIKRGALLHDMGKLGVPDNILLKPGPLTEEEWGIMKRHPQLAYEMLYPIEYLRPALDIPYCHHEKWDGTGYPKGLKGEEIPLAARIFAVVDVWDALNSDRPYRPAWTREKVREHICSLSGTHFEPNVAEVFLKMEW